MRDVYKDDAELSPKNDFKLSKHGISTARLSRKTVHEVEKQWLSGKEKVFGAVASTESEVNSFLGNERIHFNRYHSKRMQVYTLRPNANILGKN